MARTPPLYTRLTRNATGVGSYSSLWLASDHLMIVRSTGYNENYSRLQLSDLKGVFLTATERRLWWGIFWAIFTVLGGTVMAIALVTKETPIVSVFFFALGVIGLVINHRLGPGCRAYVLTGVQTAELPSLVRFKQAQRVLARLQPLIAAAQAHLVVAPPAARAVPARLEATPTTAETAPVAGGAEAVPLPEAPTPPAPPPPPAPGG